MRPALEVAASVPPRGVDVDVAYAPGEIHAVLGANGSGKSTLLGLAAGTLRPAHGTVRVAGATVAGPRTWVPAHRRGVGLLAQEPLLFPHLDVTANVAFGLRARGMGRGEATRRAAAELELVGMSSYARRRPRELSGGQQQRVAIARALAAGPQLFLLDEPLAALDVTAAAQLRTMLRRVLREARRATLLVTHDLLDVLALADTVTVLDEGRVAQRGPTPVILAQPRTQFLADLIGVNLVIGEHGHNGLHAPGLTLQGTTAPEVDLQGATQIAALFSPRAVAVHRDHPGGSPRNHLAVRVTAVEQRGELISVTGAVPGGPTLRAEITPGAIAALGVAVGEQLSFVVKAAEVQLYPA